VTCFADARAEEAFLPATLEVVRPCPARPEYVELCFSTPEGAWNWCFPRPPQRRRPPTGPIALRSGPYGVHAYLLGEHGPGTPWRSPWRCRRSGRGRTFTSRAAWSSAD